MSKPIPQRLKKLESSDLLPIKDKNGDFLIVTKQETTNIIREFVKNEVLNFSDNFIDTQNKTFQKNVDSRMAYIEKSIDAFIEYKFNLLAEKVCDMLINRKFNEEVNRKVEEHINNKKKYKGKF